MDQEERKNNILNAGSSLKNYEFDFKLPGASSSGLATLKEQKQMGGKPALEAAEVNIPNAGIKENFPSPALAATPLTSSFYPMAAPWLVAQQRLESTSPSLATTQVRTVTLSAPQSVQVSFKEKATTGGPVNSSGSQTTLLGLDSGPSTSSITLPAGAAPGGVSTVSTSAIASTWTASAVGSASGKRPDAFAGLWNDVKASSSNTLEPMPGFLPTTPTSSSSAHVSSTMAASTAQQPASLVDLM